MFLEFWISWMFHQNHSKACYLILYAHLNSFLSFSRFMFPDFTFDKNVKLQNLAKNHEKSWKNCKISRKFPKFRIYLPDEFSVHFYDSNFIKVHFIKVEFHKSPDLGDQRQRPLNVEHPCSNVRQCSLFFELWNVRCSNVRQYPNVRKFECSDFR